MALNVFHCFQTWLFLAVDICQFWVQFANFFVKFGYKAFWNLATLDVQFTTEASGRDQHGSGLDRTGSGLKPILAGSGLDRTGIFLKFGESGLDRTEKIFLVLMWLFWTYQKFQLSLNFTVLLNGSVYLAINGKSSAETILQFELYPSFVHS